MVQRFSFVRIAAISLLLLATIIFALSTPVHRFRERHYSDKRELLIEVALFGVDSPIVILGDSITERAHLPRSVCGHPFINAGIGGLRISDFDDIAVRLLNGTSAFMVVIALGANDRGSGRAHDDYLRLIERVRPFSPRLLGISVAPDDETIAGIRDAAQQSNIPFIVPDIPAGSRDDGVHLNANGYATWLPALMQGILSGCERVTPLRPDRTTQTSTPRWSALISTASPSH